MNSIGAASEFADSLSVMWRMSDATLNRIGLPRLTLFGDYMRRLGWMLHKPNDWLYEFSIGYSKVFFFAAFFTSIWLWLYAGSGFLLKAA